MITRLPVPQAYRDRMVAEAEARAQSIYAAECMANRQFEHKIEEEVIEQLNIGCRHEKAEQVLRHELAFRSRTFDSELENMR